MSRERVQLCVGCIVTQNSTKKAKIPCSHVKHRWSLTRASPGIARVKFWSIVLIAYHYIVLRDDEAEQPDSKDNRSV